MSGCQGLTRGALYRGAMEGLEGFLKASLDLTFASEKICYNDSCRGDDNFVVLFGVGG